MPPEAHEKEHGSEGHGEGGGGHKSGHGGGGHGHGGGEHEESGAPEWLISFADNVALLMGFFVILLAMNMAKQTTGGVGGEDKHPSSTPTDRELDFVIGVREAFNQPIDVNGASPSEAALRKRLRAKQSKGETTMPGPQGDEHDVQAVRPSDYINIAASISFTPGSSALAADAHATIEQAAEPLKGKRWIIEVRGHVSAYEAMRDKRRALDLAYDRAMAVAQALVEAGIPWERLRVVSCGDSHTPTNARNPNSQQTNQRAEIVQTPESIPENPFGDDQPGAVHSPSGPEEGGGH